MNEHSAKVLWTGGWDSTFRVLALALVDERPVQPFYIVDTERRSTRHELLAMRRIRDALRDRSERAAARILPTVIRDAADVPPNQMITRAFERLRSARWLGSQYEWLARFADDHRLTDLELCVHRDDRAYACVSELVESAGGRSRVADAHAGTDPHTLFRYFSFPLAEMSKTSMWRQARAIDIGGLLDLTWFCHRPRADGRACGTCNPCVYTIEEGLARRVPVRGRASYYASPAIRFRQLERRSRLVAGVVTAVRDHRRHRSNRRVPAR